MKFISGFIIIKRITSTGWVVVENEPVLSDQLIEPNT
jgi:hypothetical protein